MTLKQPNRIPAEELDNISTWALPEIDSAGNIISTAEKEERERQREEQRRASEVVEEVEVDAGQMSFEPITAQQLQEITETAEKEGYEQGHQQGYQAGQAEGYKAGQTQGAADMRAQLQAEQQRLQAIADALMKPIAPQDSAIEKALLDIVCILTRSLVKRELLTDSGHILSVVQEAVAALPVGAKNLTIHLNPDDLVLIEAFAEERQKDWQFVGDSNLLPGGCRIETRESLVDHTVEQRMEALLSQFVSKQLASGEEQFAEEESDSDTGAHSLPTAVPAATEAD